MSTTTATDLREKTTSAAARFLDRRGYEIVERGWECAAGRIDIVAVDEDGVLALIEVRAAEGEFPEPDDSGAHRREREGQAIAYLAQSDFAIDFPVRFDDISVAVLDGGRALIRYRINAYGPEPR